MEDKHIDHEWIYSKFNGQGASFKYYGKYGIAKIGYIYGVNKIQIFIYNTILWFKWIKRKYKRFINR